MGSIRYMNITFCHTNMRAHTHLAQTMAVSGMDKWMPAFRRLKQKFDGLDLTPVMVVVVVVMMMIVVVMIIIVVVVVVATRMTLIMMNVEDKTIDRLIHDRVDCMK